MSPSGVGEPAEVVCVAVGAGDIVVVVEAGDDDDGLSRGKGLPLGASAGAVGATLAGVSPDELIDGAGLLQALIVKTQSNA